MKIITTKTEQIEIERDIELPFYATDNACHWYKILNEKQLIQVTLHKDIPDINPCIQIGHLGLLFGNDYTQINETEFETKFQETIARILSPIAEINSLISI